MIFRQKFRRSVLILVVVSMVLLIMSGCSSSDEGAIKTDTPSTDTSATSDTSNKVSESSKIIEATNAYLTSGRAPTISADDVYNLVVKGGNKDYFLVSVRKPEDYAKGHIKGAINIPYGEFYKKENLTKLPKDKKIVVICYTGHTASQITLLLNQLGYEAYAMKFGMMGWTSDPNILAIPAFTKAADYETDVTPVEAQANNELPVISTGGASAEDIILAQTEKYLTSGKAPTISAADVYNQVVKGGSKDYVLLSVRKAEDYAKGHVKGTINILYGEIAKEENLKKLPKDKKIIVICYTGHTASQVTMFLNQLGYDAYAMKFGIMGWTSNSEVLAIKPFVKAPNYPTVAGTNP